MTTRKANGQKERDIEQARLDTEAAELRAQRMSYPKIAAQQGCSVSTAYERVKRAIAAVPFEAVEELRRVELESLDELERAAIEVLRTKHIRVDHGRVIEVDGERLIDDSPVLQAIACILRVKQQRARLVPQLEAPSRTEVTHFDGDSNLDREIEHLLAEMGSLEQGEASLEAAGSGEPTHP